MAQWEGLGRSWAAQRGPLRLGVPASLLAVDDDGQQDPPRGDECQIHGACTINVSNTVLWVLWVPHGRDIHKTAAELQEALGASAAGRTGVHPYARSNSGQARSCCRQVALDCGGCSPPRPGSLHARAERGRAFVKVASPRWICSARHRMQRARACKSVDRRGQTGRDETPWGGQGPIGRKSWHTVQYSRVQSDSGDPRILQGRGVRSERSGSWSWMSALRWRLQAAVEGRPGVAVHHIAAAAGWPPCAKLFCDVV
jgi:hypothetical protein